MQMELLSSGGGPTGRCQGQFEIDDGVTPVEIANVAQSVADYCVHTSFYILDATAGDYDFNWYFNKASSGGSNVSVRRKRLTILKVVE
ncbi:MAG: hypothetical protein DRO11_02240 [Methanobacteriota archaeon]|nr:MAG: hypothetical protein DRO11_02240 [Euryarchaeota archaeon]